MKIKYIKVCLVFIIFMCIFTFDGVMAVCVTNCSAESVKDWNNNGGQGSQGAGKCITGSMCQNQNVIILQTEIAHIDTTGKQVYDTVYWTNNKNYAGGKTVYAPWMTTKPNDYGTAATQLEQYLSADNYSATKQLLKSAGITSFQGSQNGSNAYGLISQALVQYKNTNGGLSWTTMKDYAATNPTNRARALEYLSKIATGQDSLLHYVKGMSSGQCAGGNLAAAASPMSGCGLNIIDIAQLCEELELIKTTEIRTPSCPGGEMNKSGSIANCYPGKGGNEFGFSNSPSGGGRSDVHMIYGMEREYVGSYCSLYCQEYGTATLPGATGETLGAGQYIIWPTSDLKHDASKFAKDYYPLKFSGKLYCKLGVLPDPSMPGSNGQCFYDPVKDYEESWQVVKGLWNQKDYLNYSFEIVRKDIIRTVGSSTDPGKCTPNYSVGGESCALAGVDSFETCGPYPRCNGQPLETEGVPCIENLVQERRRAMEAAKSAMDEAISYYNSIPDSCENCTYDYDGTPHCSDPCKRAKKAAEAAMKAAIAEYNAAKAAYERAVSEQKRMAALIQTIHQTINTCREYLTHYKRDCAILEEMRKCGIYSPRSDLYDFDSNVSFHWNDEESYYGLYVTKDESKSYNYISKSSSSVEVPDGKGINDVNELLAYPSPKFQGDVNAIKDREFEASAGDTWTLESNYQYVDKKDLKWRTYPTTNYFDVGQGVIPTSYKNKVGKNYQLILDGITFGSYLSNFGDGARYVCDQDFQNHNGIDCKCPMDSDYPGKDLMPYVKTGKLTCADAQKKYCYRGGDNDGCKCPEGTKNAGMNLDNYVAAGMTCPAAQEKYCGGPSDDCPPTDPNYPDCDGGNPGGGTPYCDKPMDYISLGPCVNAGFTESECKARICPNICASGQCPIKCKNSNGVGGKMDITACVETKMMQLNITVNEAIDICDQLVCPIGDRIIYRTIKLENPFPGKNISKIVDGFNNDVKGRYPGTNWNSKTLVYQKIRNNRNGSSSNIYDIGLGSNIYQKRTPLYTFVLNGATIERIRNYNSTREAGYNDFDLTCLKNHSAACRSAFVHNVSYGLVGGACQEGNRSSFYTCDD